MKMKDLVLEHYRKVYETEMDGLTVRVWKPKTMEQLPAYRMKHVIDHYADEARNSWRFSESRKVQWLGGNPDHGAWDAQIVRRFDPRKQSLDIYFAALLIRPFSKQAFDYYGERMSLDPQMRLVLMWDSRVYDKWHGYDTSYGAYGNQKEANDMIYNGRDGADKEDMVIDPCFGETVGNNGLTVKYRMKDGNIETETSWPTLNREYVKKLTEYLKPTMQNFLDFNKEHPEFTEMHFYTEPTLWEQDLDDIEEVTEA